MAAVVSLSHLYIGFAAHAEPLLRDFSAELQPKELVCLMGPNGAGKTTLLRTLLGLHPPLQGNIQIEGQELASLSRRFLAQHISVVLPGRITAGNLTAEELVALGPAALYQLERPIYHPGSKDCLRRVGPGGGPEVPVPASGGT